MFASRFSRFVGRIANEAIKGRSSVGRRCYFGGSMNNFYFPTKNRLFCTNNTRNTHEEDCGQKETYLSSPLLENSVSLRVLNKNRGDLKFFENMDGEEKLIKVPIGMSMLEAAHQNDIELEGACEGSLACSTCHVIVTDVEHYNKLEEPTDEENDMLDLAFGLTETSRLGCQIIARPELDGIRLALPAATRNFAVDGYVPKPH